jgi:DnaJ family protein C protein 2
VAKKLKQQEQARITLLVERAMAADPRLIQERKRLIEEKEMKKKQREQDALDKKQKEEEARLVEEKRIQEEKEQRAQEKHQREKEKKMLRKTKQAFRKLVADALVALLEPEHALEHPVDDICATLNRGQLLKFIARLESIQSDPAQVVQAVKQRACNLDKEEDENEPPFPNGASASSIKESAAAEPSVTPTPEPAKNNSNAKTPFTKEELSTLAKGVKKFPPGGANRWDQIASYINNVCRPDNPRTREECIEVFNQNKTSKAPQAPAVPAVPVVASKQQQQQPVVVDSHEDDVWTEEQDKLLQDGLASNPATMDKNERWTNIAKCVPGKTKKQCVARFKAIRDAIVNKK